MSGYQVQRTATIGAEPEKVYQEIVHLRQWESWSPWADLDPDMEVTYGDTDGEVGSSYAWKGNRKAGEGSMRITEADAPNAVVIDLRFLKPFKSQSETRFDLEDHPDGTKVTWTMTGSYTALSRVFSVFMPMDKLVGGDFENGLAKLKAHVET